jgi:heterodisulfide reductase subunit C
MSLRRAVKNSTGQDVYACHACFDCEIPFADEMDIPLGSLIQLILQDDEEALHTRTLWSDTVLEAARGACKRGLDIRAVMLALREETIRRSDRRAVHPDQ